MDGELTVQILREIRDEIRGTRADLSARIDDTNLRLDSLHRHVVTSDMRLSTELAELTTVNRGLYKIVVGQRGLTARVDRCEREIADLKPRVP